MGQFPIDEAQIVGLFLESLFFGFHLVTLFLCLRVLLDSELGWRRTRINWLLLIATLSFSIFATLDIALGLWYNLHAFVCYQHPGGAITEFSHISDWVNVMKVRSWIAIFHYSHLLYVPSRWTPSYR